MVSGPCPGPVANLAIELLPPGPVPIETVTKSLMLSSKVRTANRWGACRLPDSVDNGSSTCKAEASGFIGPYTWGGCFLGGVADHPGRAEINRVTTMRRWWRFTNFL